jgi:hypothetical protein
MQSNRLEGMLQPVKTCKIEQLRDHVVKQKVSLYERERLAQELAEAFQNRTLRS